MRDLLHRLRRFFWSISGIYNAWLCRNCGANLSDEERTYYGGNCERCEGFEFRRFEAIERESARGVSRLADDTVCNHTPIVLSPPKE